MKDLRSPLAKARDEWLGTKQASRLSQSTLGLYDRQFLENRLIEAFIAGWDACKKQKSKKARK